MNRIMQERASLLILNIIIALIILFPQTVISGIVQEGVNTATDSMSVNSLQKGTETPAVKLSGNINGQYTISNSPYVVDGDITILQNATVIIDAGVVFKFNAGTSLSVFGGLTLNGTSGNKVKFTANTTNPSKGYWDGIYIYSSNIILFHNAITEYALKGVSCFSNSNIEFSNTLFQNNGRGIELSLESYETATIQVKRSELLYNNCGLYLRNAPLQSVIENNVIARNDTGICADSKAININNCTIAFNSQHGFATTDGITSTAKNCIFWNFVSNGLEFTNVQREYCLAKYGWGGTNISVDDPLFLNPENNNFHETENSAAVDAGDPADSWSNELPPNGGRINIGAYGNTSEAASKNSAPTASFTISPGTGTAATVFTFDASGSSDIEDGTSGIQFRWDFNGDGTWDIDYPANKIQTYKYDAPDNYKVILEVKDSKGLSDTSVSYVSVTENHSPTAYFSISPPSGTSSTVFTFDASGSFDVEDDTSGMQFRWDFNGDGAWDIDYPANKIQTYKYDAPDNYKVILEVKDSEGLSDTSVAYVAVTENNPPTADFTFSPALGTILTQFTFNASTSTDIDDSIGSLEVRWDWDAKDNKNWDTEFTTDKIITKKFPRPGEFAVKMEIRDRGMLTDSVVKTIVIQNISPVADFSITPFSGYPWTVFSYDASSSSDSEDSVSALMVRWNWESNGSWDTDFANSKRAYHLYGAAGTYTASLEVRDTYGSSDIAQKSINIRDNHAPNAHFRYQPDSGYTYTEFTFYADSSYDPDEPMDTLQYNWDWEGDGRWDTGFLKDSAATHTYSRIGNYTVRLQVIDLGGIPNTFSKNISIKPPANNPPSASFTIVPESGSILTVFSFDASGVSDIEDPVGVLQVRWDWENNNIFDTEYSFVKEITHVFADTGVYTVRLRVLDAGGLYSDFVKSVAVRPAAPEITVSANTINFGDVQVDQEKYLALTITNNGITTLSITDIAFISNVFHAEPSSLSINASESKEMVVYFHPVSVRNYDEFMTIENNDKDLNDQSYEIHLIGNGIDSSGPAVGPIEKTIESAVVTLQAIISDLGRGNSNIWEAEYFIDSIDINGTGTRLILKDGNANSSTEIFEGSINISNWLPGSHSIYVHGRDVHGNWGQFDFIEIIIRDSVPPNIDHTGSEVSTGIAGEDKSISARISDNGSMNEVRLYYRTGGETTYRNAIMTSSDNSNYNVNISRSYVTSKGLEYYIQAMDQDSNVTTEPPENPALNPYSLRVHMSSVSMGNSSFPAGTGTNSFRMFSVPVELTDKSIVNNLGDDFGSANNYNKEKWRIFRWSGTKYDEHPSVGVLEPGRAFWVIVKEANPNILVTEGTSLSTGEAYSILLESGWNQIGNPFNFQINWQDIRAATNDQNLESSIWYFDGAYTTSVSNIRPWEGYFVYNKSSNAIYMKIPPRTNSAPKSAVKIDEEPRWEINLQVSASGASDNENVFGVHEKASDEYDYFDYSKPPLPLPTLECAFLTVDNNGHEKRLGGDYKHYNDQGNEWKFVVNSALQDSPVTITWDIPETLQQGFQIRLYNTSKLESVDMREQLSYLYVPNAHNKTYFTIVTGTPEYINIFESDNSALPDKIQLFQNYPNPFNGSTMIRFYIPHDQYIALEVYNILGQLIKTIIADYHSRGRYEFQWDGLNNNGIAIGSGVYIAVLKSSHAIESRKMLLLR